MTLDRAWWYGAALGCMLFVPPLVYALQPAEKGRALDPVAVAGLRAGGTYLLQVDARGAVSVTSIVVVTVGEDPVDPGPGPDPQPSALRAFVREELAKIKTPAPTAGKLGALYVAVGKLAREGKIANPQQASDRMRSLFDATLEADGRDADAAWTNFRAALKTKLESMATAGEIKTTADVGKAFDEIGRALLEGNAIDLGLVIQLVLKLFEGDGFDGEFLRLLLQVLADLFGGQVAGAP